MLGWILFGLFATVAGAVIISGIVNKNRIKEQMRERGIREAIITKIDRCANIVKLESLYGSDVLEIQGDELDYELNKNDRIYA